jgi:hypothetical protein
MTEAQFGNYTCVATNLYGRGEATLTITGKNIATHFWGKSRSFLAWKQYKNKHKLPHIDL